MPGRLSGDRIGSVNEEISRQADAVAAQLAHGAASYEAQSARFADAWRGLLAAVAASNARYAFDRDGRPDAIAAVRRALPAMERELLDAVVEDHTCELAAVQEAMYQLVLAVSRTARPADPSRG